MQSTIKIVIDSCDKIVGGVKRGELEIGLIETPVFDESLNYKKWMEDELVICSKTPLGESLGYEELSHCQLLCRNENSPTRMFISEFFHKHGLSYGDFHSLMEVNNTTSAIQGIKWSRPNRTHPTITIVSQLAIEEELNRKELYVSRIGNERLRRNFYLIYRKQDDVDQMDGIIKILSQWRE